MRNQTGENIMRTLLAAIFGLTIAMSSAYATQSLSFTGPTTWTPGGTFTLQVNDTFTNFGGSYGLSYWLQVNDALAGFLTITSLTYNLPFTDGNNIGTFPFSFISLPGADTGFVTTTTANGQSGDLGATSNPLVIVPDGTYADITDITFALAAGAPTGTYTLRTTTASPRGSIQVTSDFGDAAFPQASFVFSVVPEPSTLALIGLAGLGAGVIAYRRRK
jgi:hypothetical protein